MYDSQDFNAMRWSVNMIRILALISLTVGLVASAMALQKKSETTSEEATLTMEAKLKTSNHLLPFAQSTRWPDGTQGVPMLPTGRLVLFFEVNPPQQSKLKWGGTKPSHGLWYIGGHYVLSISTRKRPRKTINLFLGNKIVGSLVFYDEQHRTMIKAPGKVLGNFYFE